MTPMFDSGWFDVSAMPVFSFNHGLGVAPNHIMVTGRESQEGPAFELINMVHECTDEIVVLHAKLKQHCQEARMECYFADSDTLLHTEPVTFQGTLQTPWLKEVDAL